MYNNSNEFCQKIYCIQRHTVMSKVQVITFSVAGKCQEYVISFQLVNIGCSSHPTLCRVTINVLQLDQVNSALFRRYSNITEKISNFLMLLQEFDTPNEGDHVRISQ